MMGTSGTHACVVVVAPAGEVTGGYTATPEGAVQLGVHYNTL